MLKWSSLQRLSTVRKSVLLSPGYKQGLLPLAVLEVPPCWAARSPPAAAAVVVGCWLGLGLRLGLGLGLGLGLAAGEAAGARLGVCCWGSGLLGVGEGLEGLQDGAGEVAAAARLAVGKGAAPLFATVGEAWLGNGLLLLVLVGGEVLLGGDDGWVAAAAAASEVQGSQVWEAAPCRTPHPHSILRPRGCRSASSMCF
jgi:hypothetical protein